MAHIPKRLDCVPVPYDLNDWAQTSEALELIETIREKSGVESITFSSPRPGKGDFTISAASNDPLRAARSLLEMHLAFQVEYQQRKVQTEKMEEDLRLTNEEFEKGLRVEFSVPENLIGLVIGKGGANVNKVKDATGVSKIIVDGETRTVRIRGHSPESVRQAREMLEYQEVALPIPAHQTRIIIGEKGRNINELYKKSGVVRCNIHPDPNGSGDRILRLVGTTKTVDLARELVKTQIDFEEKLNNLRSDEIHIKRQLAKIDQEFREPGLGGGSMNFRRRSSASSSEHQAPVAKAQVDDKKFSPPAPSGSSKKKSTSVPSQAKKAPQAKKPAATQQQKAPATGNTTTKKASQPVKKASPPQQDGAAKGGNNKSSKTSVSTKPPQQQKSAASKKSGLKQESKKDTSTKNNQQGNKTKKETPKQQPAQQQPKKDIKNTKSQQQPKSKGKPQDKSKPVKAPHQDNTKGKKPEQPKPKLAEQSVDPNKEGPAKTKTSRRKTNTNEKAEGNKSKPQQQQQQQQQQQRPPKKTVKRDSEKQQAKGQPTGPKPSDMKSKAENIKPAMSLNTKKAQKKGSFRKKKTTAAGGTAVDPPTPPTAAQTKE